MKETRKKAPPAYPQSAHELLAFYHDYATYYRKWARWHRTTYWALVYLSIACGILLAWLLLSQAETLYVAQVALALNCLLIINAAAKPDRKYPRYRMVEIRLAFELQKMRHGVAQRINAGEAPESALLSAMEALHAKVETLVLEEFGEFFRDFTSLQELHGQLNDAGTRKQPKP